MIQAVSQAKISILFYSQINIYKAFCFTQIVCICFSILHFLCIEHANIVGERWPDKSLWGKTEFVGQTTPTGCSFNIL